MALLIGSQVALLSIDFSKLGLASADGIDLGRWLLIFPGQVLLGFFLLATSSQLWRSLRSPSVLIFGAWLVWLLLTAFWSVDARQTVLQGIGAVNLWLAAIWLIAGFGSETFFRLSARAIGFISFAGAIFQVTVGIENDAMRLEGLSEGFNQFAIQCALGLIMSIGLVLSGKSTRIDWIVTGWFGVGLLASGGRGGLAATCVALAIAVTPRLVQHRRRWYFAALGGFGVVAAAGFLSIGIGSFARGEERTTLNGRELIWSHAWDLVREAPIKGHGMMTGFSLWTEAVVAGALDFRAGSAHNMTLELVVGGGTVGLALFTAAAIVTLRQLIKQQQWTWLALFSLILIAGFIESMVARPSLAYWIFGATAASTVVATSTVSGADDFSPPSKSLELIS